MDFKNFIFVETPEKFSKFFKTDDEIISFLKENYPVDLHKEQAVFSALSEEGFAKWNKECRFNTQDEKRNKRLEELKSKCWNGNMQACEACKFLMTHEESWHFKLAKNIRKAEQRGDTERLAQLRSRVYPDHPL